MHRDCPLSLPFGVSGFQFWVFESMNFLAIPIRGVAKAIHFSIGSVVVSVFETQRSWRIYTVCLYRLNRGGARESKYS